MKKIEPCIPVYGVYQITEHTENVERADQNGMPRESRGASYIEVYRDSPSKIPRIREENIYAVGAITRKTAMFHVKHRGFLYLKRTPKSIQKGKANGVPLTKRDTPSNIQRRRLKASASNI